MAPSSVLGQKTHEEQLESLQTQVEALREQLHRAQRLAAIGTMTAMVAHEFNNILTPIINYAQLAKRNPRMVEKAIARASEGGQRASDICKAILGLTRGEDDDPHDEPLVELVSETLTAMGRDLGKDRIDLAIDCPPDLTVRVRRLEIQHVLLNIIINARAAVMSKPGSRRIEIAATRSNGHIVIRVADNGTGIDPELMDKIFLPFFSTKSSADASSGGHGLGLAICHDIMMDMGGRIAVDSTPGEGTTFTLHIPA